MQQIDGGDLPQIGEHCTGAYPWPSVPHAPECNAGTWRCFNGYLDCLSLGTQKLGLAKLLRDWRFLVLAFFGEG